MPKEGRCPYHRIPYGNTGRKEDPTNRCDFEKRRCMGYQAGIKADNPPERDLPPPRPPRFSGPPVLDWWLLPRAGEQCLNASGSYCSSRQQIPSLMETPRCVLPRLSPCPLWVWAQVSWYALIVFCMTSKELPCNRASPSMRLRI
ncbi:hypothetical protein Holit_02348 [Hollandina sp. SP2]